MKHLCRAIAYDMRRALSAYTGIAILMIPVCIVLDNPDAAELIFMSSDISFAYLINYSMISGGLYSRFVLVMLCALPYAAGFCAEYNTSFSVYMIPRTTEKAYFFSKYFVSVVLGSLVVTLGILLLYFITSFNLPLMQYDDFESFSVLPYYSRMRSHEDMLFLRCTLYYNALYGALWAAAATCTSAYFTSPFVVMASPFIWSFLFTFILKALRFPNDYRMDLWLNMSHILHSEEITMLLSAVFVAAAVLIMGYAYYRKGRRLMHGE